MYLYYNIRDTGWAANSVSYNAMRAADPVMYANTDPDAYRQGEYHTVPDFVVIMPGELDVRCYSRAVIYDREGEPVGIFFQCYQLADGDIGYNGVPLIAGSEIVQHAAL